MKSCIFFPNSPNKKPFPSGKPVNKVLPEILLNPIKEMNPFLSKVPKICVIESLYKSLIVDLYLFIFCLKKLLSRTPNFISKINLRFSSKVFG